MLTMSLLSTALSFFVAPVCEDLGFGRGSFTLYYSLMVASGAVSASFLGTYMNRKGVRGVVLVSGVWCGLGFLGLSFSSQLWMFYILGAAMGLFGSTCVYLAASAVGTVAEGVICSKLGIQKTMLGVLVIYAVGFVLMSMRIGIYVALVCLAFGSGSIGTLMPVVVRRIFGGRDYAAIWSVVISCSSVASFVAAPVWGMVYDVCGSYGPALMTMPVLLALSIFCLLGAFRNMET